MALKVRLESKERNDCIVHFTVSDTGIGIAREKLGMIFDPFSQADSSTTRHYGGTGLGLTISTRLIEKMGGIVWVESEIGRGTQFHFTIRLGATDGKGNLIGTIAPPEILRGVKVLIVDDNRTNRRILEGMLKRWDMKSTSVPSGEEALVQLSAAWGARAFWADPDGHAHARNGRFRPRRAYSPAARAIHCHDHDAYLSRTQGRRRTMQGTRSVCVLIEADPAVRIARGHRASAWSAGTNRSNSSGHSLFPGGRSRTGSVAASLGCRRQCRKSAFSPPDAGEERTSSAGRQQWAGGLTASEEEITTWF